MTPFKPLTRDQLAKFLPDNESIRRFEQLFQEAGVDNPATIALIFRLLQELSIDLGTANSSAGSIRDALASVSRNLDQIIGAPTYDAGRVDLIDSIARAIEIVVGNIDAKSNQNSDSLSSLIRAIESDVTRPGFVFPRSFPVDYIDYGKAIIPAWNEGRVFYDDATHALSYYNEASDVTLNLGRESLIRVKNITGSGMASGQVVYINGADSGWPTVTLAQANNETSYKSTIGVVTSTIANGQFGYVTTFGVVNGLDTSAFTAGQAIYLSATAAGATVTTKPLQPNYVVAVGYVLTSSVSVGSIFIRIDRDPWFPTLQLIDTTATQLVPTVPTILKPPTTVYNDGFTYNSTTGEFTVLVSGTYSVSMLFNFGNGNSNRIVYFYVDEDKGAGYVISRYSARAMQLQNFTNLQYTLAASVYYAAGTKFRLWYWGNNAAITIETADVPPSPNTLPLAGTVTIPAFRYMIA